MTGNTVSPIHRSQDKNFLIWFHNKFWADQCMSLSNTSQMLQMHLGCCNMLLCVRDLVSTLLCYVLSESGIRNASSSPREVPKPRRRLSGAPRPRRGPYCPPTVPTVLTSRCFMGSQAFSGLSRLVRSVKKMKLHSRLALPLMSMDTHVHTQRIALVCGQEFIDKVHKNTIKLQPPRAGQAGHATTCKPI